MTKKTEARLTPYEKTIYNDGQLLIKQGKEKMEKARFLAADREERVREQERVREAVEKQRTYLEARNTKFKVDIDRLASDIWSTSRVYSLELDPSGVGKKFDFDAPFCDVTIRFRPMV